MRPERLVIRAFGPYSEEVTLNFDCLGERTLFLIHGPTGGGKTTVLDAISYALYGETSGGEREGQGMRCDLAPPDMATEIELDFRLGLERYRVRRRPRQLRPKKRGEGFVEEQTKGLLFCRTKCTKEDDDGELLAAKARAVTEQIEHVLGFTAAQFRQVVILPQGKFRQLLVADSKERQAILDALFQTGFYRLVEERLKERAKEAAQELSDLLKKRSLLLQQLSLEDESQLEEATAGLKKEQESAKQKLKENRAEEASASEKLAAARRAKEKLDELESAKKALNELMVQKEHFAEQRKLLASAKRAVLLEDLQNNLKERKADEERAQKLSKAAHIAKEEALQALQKSQALLKKEEDRETERVGARKEAAHLANLEGAAHSLQEGKEALEKCEKNAQESKRCQLAAKQKVSELEEKLLERKKALDLAKEAGRLLDSHQTSWQKAKETLAAKEELEMVAKELGKAQKSLVAATEKEQQAARKLDELLTQRTEIERAYREGQAARLASELIEGEPCPVCGSKSHPLPAERDEAVPSDDILEKAKEAVLAQEKSLRSEGEKVTEAKTNVTKSSTELQSLRKNLGEAADEELSALKNKVNSTQADVNAAELAVKQVETIEKALYLLERDLGQKKEELELHEKKLTECLADERAARSVVEERQARLPEKLRGKGQLIKALEKAQKKVEELEEALEKRKVELTKSKEEAATRESALKSALHTLDEAKKSLKELDERFEARLKEAGFTSRQECQSAQRSRAEQEAMEHSISEYDGSLKAAQKRLERASEKAKGVVLPVMEKVEAEYEATRGKLEEAISLLTKIEKEIELKEKVATEIKETYAQERKLDERYGVLGRVTALVTGKNELGMTLERFVLASLLETVLDAATQRLQYMSRKRFILQRCKERQDKRSAGGLDLEIFDNYTGTSRPVASLSGGESFLASLSLALGLADVVQSAAGGLRLDTIFVDEGFGSLDPEALDWAFRALVDLQEGGRLVGIISHVPELKERIDTRLEVQAGRKGSRATFVVP